MHVRGYIRANTRGEQTPVDSGRIFRICPSNSKPAPNSFFVSQNSTFNCKINAIRFSRCKSPLKSMWQQFFFWGGGGWEGNKGHERRREMDDTASGIMGSM